MSRENDRHSFLMTDSSVPQAVRGVYEGDEFYDEATVSPPLSGDSSAANFEHLMALLHARNRRDVIKQRPKWRTKNELVAFLKEDLADMEAALEEEQRKSQAAFADFLTANTQLREVRQELTQQQFRFQNVERALHQDLQTVRSRVQATIDQQKKAQLAHSKALEEHAQAKVSLQQQLQQVRAAQQEEKAVRQKLEVEKAYLYSKTQKLEEELEALKNLNGKMLKEQRVSDERLSDVKQALADEEEKYKNLTKLTAKNDAVTVDLDERLRKETKLRQEADKYTRKMETELNEVKEQNNAKHAQVDGLQQQLCKREEEFSHALIKCDEEAAAKFEAQKLLREIENQLVEIQVVLESEKAARAKAEKQKRDLNDGLEALKKELLDSLDKAATQQELRTKRELDLAMLNKTLEDDSTSHEMQIADLWQKHKLAKEELNEQFDDLKKTKKQCG